jgi:hypothetical protein
MDLFPLPCGCLCGHARRFRELVECPWCLAVFSFEEFQQWEPPPFIAIHPTPRIFRFGGKVLAFVKRCEDCMAPVMREGVGVKFHLPANPDHFERLWD